MRTTRHPCPFCSWYLDAPPIEHVPHLSVMELISDRLSTISDRIQDHIRSVHPEEYADAEALRLDSTG